MGRRRGRPPSDRGGRSRPLPLISHVRTLRWIPAWMGGWMLGALGMPE
jgi:hypothetical protein